MRNFRTLLLVVMTIFISSVYGQDKTNVKDSLSNQAITGQSDRVFYLIQKVDGREFFGYIIEDDGREILLETREVGRIYINKADIEKIKPFNYEEREVSTYGTEFDGAVFNTRYYFTNNALPVKKGQNYAMLHLFGPEAHFAVNDKLNLGFITSWIGSPIMLAAKYSIYTEGKQHLSYGGIAGSSGYLNNGKGYGVLNWLTYTYGDEKANFSFSGGYGLYDFGTRSSSGSGISVGDKYSFSEYEVGHEYYIGPRITSYELGNTLPDINDDLRVDDYLKETAIISVAGIAPVGKKTKFIFDSMILFTKNKYGIEYTDKTVQVDYSYFEDGEIFEVTNESVTIGEGTVVRDANSYAATIIFMPAMRFETASNRSFQVSLSGLVNIDDDGGVNSFPMPMISWLRQF